MGKYDPLRHYLSGRAQFDSEITLIFDQIEGILGASLPPSARKHSAWWDNPTGATTHSHALTRVESGFRVADVERERGWVRLRRARPG